MPASYSDISRLYMCTGCSASLQSLWAVVLAIDGLLSCLYQSSSPVSPASERDAPHALCLLPVLSLEQSTSVLASLDGINVSLSLCTRCLHQSQSALLANSCDIPKCRSEVQANGMWTAITQTSLDKSNKAKAGQDIFEMKALHSNA